MKRSAVILRNVGHGVNDIYWFLLPSILPLIIEQFHLTYGTAGGILTAFLGVAALFSFILGRISDRFPRHIILSAGFLSASIFLIGAAFMERLSVFVVLLLTAGIGVASFHPATYAEIEETTESRKGMAYGMFEFYGSVAIFAMFFLHGFLLKQLSLRNIIIITSLPGLIMGSIFLWSGRMLQFGSVHLKEIVSHETDRNKPPDILFVILLVVIALRLFSIISVVNFTPTYLVREVGLGKDMASFATSIYFIGGLIFTPIVGKLCDIRSPYPVLLIATGVIFPLILLMSYTPPLWVLPLNLILLGGTYYGSWPAMDMIIAQMSRKKGKGEAFGYFVSITAIAYSSSPLLFGIVADRVGLKLSMRFFSFPLLLCTGAFFLIFRVVRLGNTVYSSRR